MAVFNLHLQFFIIAIGEIEADATDEFMVEWQWRGCRWRGHGRLFGVETGFLSV